MRGRHRPEPYAPMSHCPQALRVSVERSESPPPHPHRAWWGAVHGATCRAPTATPGAPGPPPDPASHPGQSGGVREEALGLGLQARSWLPHREPAPLARREGTSLSTVFPVPMVRQRSLKWTWRRVLGSDLGWLGESAKMPRECTVPSCRRASRWPTESRQGSDVG